MWIGIILGAYLASVVLSYVFIRLVFFLFDIWGENDFSDIPWTLDDRIKTIQYSLSGPVTAILCPIISIVLCIMIFLRYLSECSFYDKTIGKLKKYIRENKNKKVSW